MSYAKQLVGLTLLGIRWSSYHITFITEEKGEITAEAEGDCCSTSWIESVEEPARGYPAKVLEVRNTDLPWYDSNPPDSDYVDRKYYGLRVTTDNGDIDIDYRNDSNGYYGGSLNFPYVEGVPYL